MQKSKKCLLIGSIAAYSGKSATILGIAHRLQEQGIEIGYGKPIGIFSKDSGTPAIDADVQFLSQVLKLSESHVHPTLISLDNESIAEHLQGANPRDYQAEFQRYTQTQSENLLILEGPSSLEEGKLFNLSLVQMASLIDAAIVLVARFKPTEMLDAFLTAKEQLGDRLIGVVINDIPDHQFEMVKTVLQPFLLAQGIEVLGALPHSDLLKSVSVGELVERLGADVLCCHDRMDLMVESLTIGAMNVNSALKYFRKGRNKAVITGGDRTDLQLAALETSTQCLILTGHISPDTMILGRAEDLEVPILSVDLDTLTTVEIIEQAFRQVELHEAIKVQCVFDLMAQYLDLDRLLEKLAIE